ncbi:sigma 54-interacting transcriptional regulator [Ruminococcaceae bacterium OttesenSCG-928-O06]|nr:sigma 54-interacting transcriptional regulator [Ruminococcaceae bacterium OttesenSCG-928-O06]
MERETLASEKIVHMLDAINQGIYILDTQGHYLYVNDEMVRLHGHPKSSFARSSVYNPNAVSFDIRVTDIVLREKRQVTMFQDINDKHSKRKFRQIITSTPIFDDSGNVKYIIAVVESLSRFAQRFQAAQQSRVSAYSFIGPDSQDRQLVAESRVMREILGLVDHVAKVDSTVMITGETGTGKEVIVRQLHEQSTRKEKSLVEINCAAFPDDLLETELFGYVKGAFTGASTAGKTGLIEAAEGGTLFLDEINSMSLSLQSKLLRVIEDKKVRPLGSTEERNVDFRLVVATNQDLWELCQRKQFREDLYYRLNVVHINVPPLRERAQDILPLADLFLHEFCTKYAKQKSLSQETMEQLLSYSWPGNVRELRNLIERLVVTSADDVMEVRRIPDALFEAKSEAQTGGDGGNFIMVEGGAAPLLYEAENFSLQRYMDDCEKKLLQSLLSSLGSTTKVAEVLKINRATMARKRQKHNL